MFSKKVTDNRVKNTKRKIPEETKKIVWNRDEWKCIFCWNYTSDHFHHIYWGWDADYSEYRNEHFNLVLACNDCHHKCHFTDKSKEMREFWKNYILKFIWYVPNDSNKTIPS